MGLRPDRAVTVYSNLIRQTYKNTPIILGGDRSLSQKNGPLRLLGRCYETFGPAGFRSRYDLLWNGREEYPEDCRSSGYGNSRRTYYKYSRNRCTGPRSRLRRESFFPLMRKFPEIKGLMPKALRYSMRIQTLLRVMC